MHYWWQLTLSCIYIPIWTSRRIYHRVKSPITLIYFTLLKNFCQDVLFCKHILDNIVFYKNIAYLLPFLIGIFLFCKHILDNVLSTEILLKLLIIKIISVLSVNNMHLIKPSIIYALQSDQAAFTKLSIFGIHCELIIVFILNLYQY